MRMAGGRERGGGAVPGPRVKNGRQLRRRKHAVEGVRGDVALLIQRLRACRQEPTGTQIVCTRQIERCE